MEGVVFDRKWIEDHFEALPLWQQSAYNDFAATIADEANTFPCVPARMGFLSNHLRYSFVGDSREEQSINLLAQCLRNTRKSRDLVENIQPLQCFFIPLLIC